eukprot:350941-Chlamydomonas_euryale.AAC.6
MVGKQHKLRGREPVRVVHMQQLMQLLRRCRRAHARLDPAPIAMRADDATIAPCSPTTSAVHANIGCIAAVVAAAAAAAWVCCVQRCMLGCIASQGGWAAAACSSVATGLTQRHLLRTLRLDRPPAVAMLPRRRRRRVRRCMAFLRAPADAGVADIIAEAAAGDGITSTGFMSPLGGPRGRATAAL